MFIFASLVASSAVFRGDSRSLVVFLGCYILSRRLSRDRELASTIIRSACGAHLCRGGVLRILRA